jgi:hypothetical protein
MSLHVRRLIVITAVVPMLSALALAQIWNSPGLPEEEIKAMPPGGEAPRRDLTGVWDAGFAGIGIMEQEAEREAARAPFTPLGEKMAQRNKPGNGPRLAPVGEINDPLSTLGDPSGFPRLVNYELRPLQIARTSNQVLMLYMFEKRFRTIWTDGRALPKDPDPRWYGYSVGKWEDDTTFVVETIGLDEKTWLDNAGNPHSNDMKVIERYQRINEGTMELTVTIDDPTAYTKPWVGRNKLPLRLIPSNVDLMEMICSATEAQEYKKNMGK